MTTRRASVLLSMHCARSLDTERGCWVAGKYMEVFFDNQRRICGSSTTNYLLEKVR